ncbi:MAG: MFS transporter [Rhodospirillales bacterium]
MILALRVFAPFAFGYFLSYLLRTINAVIAPDLVRDVGLDATSLGLLSSAYFVAFAIFQIPLGVLLDRYGPRKTEAALLIFAAAGAALFAVSTTFSGLFIGRTLIGLGVSACLMAAFKVFVMWFPSERLPFINGCQMAIGGLGALSATLPVEVMLSVTDWRGIFIGLSLATVVSTLAVLFVVPEKPGAGSDETLKEQIDGFVAVFKSPHFIRLAPVTICIQSAFLAVQSLWSGPWLYDVAGMDRSGVAEHLFIIALSMVAGFLILGTIAERLTRIGIRPITVNLTGMICFMTIEGVLVLQWLDTVMVQWIVYGFFGTTSILSYAILSQTFPKHLAGRVNVALNLLLFSASFFVQWGIGAVIDLWPVTANGTYAPEGYRAAFAILLGVQVMAMAWYALYRKPRFDLPNKNL